MLLYWFAVGVARELAGTVLADRCAAVEAHDADDGWVIGFVDGVGRVLAAVGTRLSIWNYGRHGRFVVGEICSFTKLRPAEYEWRKAGRSRGATGRRSSIPVHG
jgi:hypothetical protein